MKLRKPRQELTKMQTICEESNYKIQRIQQKYDTINKINMQRSKYIQDVPEKQLQNDYNVHKFKLKYLEQKQESAKI